MRILRRKPNLKWLMSLKKMQIARTQTKSIPSLKRTVLMKLRMIRMKKAKMMAKTTRMRTLMMCMKKLIKLY